MDVNENKESEMKESSPEESNLNKSKKLCLFKIY